MLRRKITFLGLALLVIPACMVVQTPPNPSPTRDEQPAGTVTLTLETVAANTPTPELVEDAKTIQDFAGRWIRYKIINAEGDRIMENLPGSRLKISSNLLSVDGQDCDHPAFTRENIQLQDFLEGQPQPQRSNEFYQDEFPILRSHCPWLTPSAAALINPRTLAARVGEKIFFYERDSGVEKNGLRVETDLIARSSLKPDYEMHAQVPRLEKPGADDFNQIARAIVESELNGFEKNFEDWQIPTEMAFAESFLWIRYDVPYLSGDLVSIRFTVDYFMAGAAHPNHYFRVLNYDLKENHEINFSDLFKSQDEALNVLSIAGKNALTKPDFPLFEEGLTSKLENFSNWNLMDEGLRLSFDPYQVAPYAAGPQEVIVPYRDILDLVDRDTTAGKMIFNAD